MYFRIQQGSLLHLGYQTPKLQIVWAVTTNSHLLNEGIIAGHVEKFFVLNVQVSLCLCPNLVLIGLFEFAIVAIY